jgi:hypothetical protein
MIDHLNKAGVVVTSCDIKGKLYVKIYCPEAASTAVSYLGTNLQRITVAKGEFFVRSLDIPLGNGEYLAEVYICLEDVPGGNDANT